eukprot:TRINITY_DN5056_c0_g2_i2.p1 TRINITY_DN5056_c0_g2~~TRINITY_DN5056_c0_g2_i2.p1  ORF type:complete len:383 (+),score=60.89 TRINITY_DN5056_c0_g2_i2:58-1206(+)
MSAGREQIDLISRIRQPSSASLSHEPRRDAVFFLGALPEELRLNLLTFFNLPSVSVFSRLNKSWNELCNRSILWQQLCARELKIFALPSDKYKSWKQMFRECSIPLEKDPQFQRCFYGFLGQDKAEKNLNGATAGTFLFRSSNTDANAVTISYMGNNRQVKHRRMHKIPQSEGQLYYSFQQPGYKRELSDDDIFKNYLQLTTRNKHWMITPLVDRGASYVERSSMTGETIEIDCPDNVGPPSSSEIRSIAETLRSNETKAQKLHVKANLYFQYRLSSSDLITLITALEENQTIRVFTIHHMELHSSVCMALAKMLMENTTLSDVAILHCHCDGSTQLIVEALRRNQSLQNLMLNGKSWPRTHMHNLAPEDFSEFKCLPWQCF